VQQRGAQRRGVQAHAGADLGDADRVDDEVLAGDAALVGVVLAGEREGVQDGLAVDRLGDLVGVLGDDREQVREQLVLERREVVRDRDGAVVGALRPVDRAMRGDGDGRVVGAGAGLGGAARDDGRRSPRFIPRGRAADRLGADLFGRRLALGAAVQAAASFMSLLVRYRRPSSSRLW
jgi:hypothetical protein